MRHDDFEAVEYKILRYLDSCMKAGALPTVAQARAVCEHIPGRYFATVCESLSERGMVKGVSVDRYYDGSADVAFHDARITHDGSAFLRENPTMAEARGFLGTAFEAVVESAVAVLLRASGMLQ